MIFRHKSELLLCLALTTWLMLGPVPSGAQTVDLDARLLQQLQETINQQQEQLHTQSAQIQALSETLKTVQKQLDDLNQERSDAKSQTVQGLPAVQQADNASQKNSQSLMVTKTRELTKLDISGQVNRAVNIVNDGNGTDVYFVDSDVSNSRIRFISATTVTDDTTLGARLEVAIAPDESSKISQNVHTSGDFFNQRWAEVSLNSLKYGKLSLGKGDTASKNSAEVDLSQTDIVQNASVADIVGGMLFRESTNAALTTIKVADAFNDRDGLGRQSRIRYDTPGFTGFTLAGSLISNRRADAAIFWRGQGYGFKAAAAAAIANPRLDNYGLQQDGSFSILHGNTGLNLTMSAALVDGDTQKDPTNLYAKFGWITNHFDFGFTAVAIDVTRSANLPAENDIGYSASTAVVQSFDKYGAELYFQYRRYLLDRASGPSVDNLHVGTLGTRIKF